MSMQVGSEVLVSSKGDSFFLGKIIRETKTLYIVRSVVPSTGGLGPMQMQFGKATLRRVRFGAGLPYTVAPITPKTRRACLERDIRDKLVREIDGVVWSQLPTSALRGVYNIVRGVL